MDIQQLGHVTCPGIIIVPFKGGSDVGTLLGDEIPLVLGSLAGPDGSDQVSNTQRSRHGSTAGTLLVPVGVDHRVSVCIECIR